MHVLIRSVLTIVSIQVLLFSSIYVDSSEKPSGGCQGAYSGGKCGPECKCGCNEGKVCTCRYPNYQSNCYGDTYNYNNADSYYENQSDHQSDYYGDNFKYYNTQSPYYENQLDYQSDYYGDPSNYYNIETPFLDSQSNYYDNDQSYYNSCCCDLKYNDPSLQITEPSCQSGIWLPEDPVLFRPFMADPREVCYSVGWRFDDDIFNRNVIDVSFGDTLAIYRWCNVWPWDGQLQIELEGALWAIFEPLLESSPLVNADYYVGIPITYAIDCWQFRLRGYHISSHIGDEFLLTHRNFDRRNASAEYLDFFISHDLTEEIRLYAGIGCIVSQDEEFKCRPFYSAVGAELRLLRLGFHDENDVLYGCPIFAMHFRQNGEFKKHIDATYILGYEIGKLCGLQRRLRLFIEYHDGYSVEGQFCKIATNYFSIRTSYGF